jgi:hypothetical protein
MKKALLIVSLLASICAHSQLKFISVNPTTDEIGIKNFGSTTIDISTYRLCALFEYKTLNQVGISLVTGDFNLSPGEQVLFTWNASTGFNTTASDLGLYLPSGSFSSAASMVDFMQYGAAGQGRESVANTAGLWVAGTFLTGTSPWYYIGNGPENGIVQWSLNPPVGFTPNTGVRINELDCDQISSDMGEFVELYGEPNSSLDSLVVVFFNGSNSNNSSYASYDLGGYSLDENGFFVLGNPGVPNVDYTFPNNTLQNGADGVALYVGEASNWPNGTAPVTANLIDAIVYDTDNPEDTDLLAALMSGQTQINENINNQFEIQSISRVPNGGTALNSASFLVQVATPGESNVPLCSGGLVATDANQSVLTICTNTNLLTATFISNTEFPGEAYLFVLSDQNNNIIFTDEDGTIDFTALTNDTCKVWGLAYSGILTPSSISLGAPVAGISTDDCWSLSSNFVFVYKIDCSQCNAGSVTTSEGNSFISLCSDSIPDPYTFIHSGANDDNSYAYFLTSEDASVILSTIAEAGLDLDTLPIGSYSIIGFNYSGDLDSTTTEPGDLVSNIFVSSGCQAVSSSNIEIHIYDCVLGEGCTELMISEYIKGNSNDKAIEIFNPTPFPVDLSEYIIGSYVNGATTPSPIYSMSGTLSPGGVFVVANSQASAGILDLADATAGVASFSGNDAIALLHNDVPVDIIGVIGEDPGTSGWVFGNGSTVNHVLVRKPQFTAATTNWALSAGQWLVYGPGDFTHIGNHSANSCSSIAYVGFENTALIIDENIGSVFITVNAYNVTQAFSAGIDVSSESTTAGLDYTDIFPLTLNFDEDNTTAIIEIPIIDDLVEEDLYEYFTMTLSTDSTEAEITNANISISISPSDQSYPLYPINQITTTSPGGILDSIGIFCSIKGIVHGINFNSGGIHFHLVDAPGAIKVFDATDNFGYTVQEGDSVMVLGEVSQFYGMAEFYPDTILFMNSGHPLEIPAPVTNISEINESHLVKFTCMKLVDSTQWTNESSGFDVDITNEIDTVTMHIDLDSDIYGTVAPDGHFTVVGICAQFDENSPYDSNYSFWPRYLNDYSEIIDAEFTNVNIIQFGDAGASILPTNTSTGAISYNWTFGDGTNSSQSSPTHQYSYNFLSNVAEVNISLTATNAQGCADTETVTIDAVYLAVAEATNVTISMYPNPVSDILNIRSPEYIESVTITDITGKTVFSVNNLSQREFRVDTSSLAFGTYQISIQTEQGLSVGRIIKD